MPGAHKIQVTQKLKMQCRELHSRSRRGVCGRGYPVASVSLR